MGKIDSHNLNCSSRNGEVIIIYPWAGDWEKGQRKKGVINKTEGGVDTEGRAVAFYENQARPGRPGLPHVGSIYTQVDGYLM